MVSHSAASRPLAVVAATIALLTPHVYSHTWVEQLVRVAPNGTLVGNPGYPRGFVLHGSAGFQDQMMSYLVPPNEHRQGTPIYPSDKLCHPSQRTPGEQSDGYPKLQASPGDRIAIQYQDNGHVTKFLPAEKKPKNGGTIYIYGTSDPQPDESFLNVVGQWTADGQGGNKKGRLLATRNYDDGRCYEHNTQPLSLERQQQFPKDTVPLYGPNLWCQSDIQLPDDMEVGKDFTLYWVWNYPSMQKGVDAVNDLDGPIIKNEWYTTCMEVSATEGSKAASKSIVDFAASYVTGQDLNNAAVKPQLSLGNFQVEVPGFTKDGSGSNPFPQANVDPGTNAKVNGGSGSAPAPTQAPAPPSSSACGKSGMTTVTITPAVTTVYITKTVQPTGTGLQDLPNQTNAPSAAPTPSPFLPRLRKIRRDAGEWHFGQ